MNKYYVYGLIDPRDKKIKYIGKGSGNRMFDHFRKAKLNKADSNNFIKLSSLQEIIKEGYLDIAYCKLFETNDEFLAYTEEEKLIKEYHTHASEGGWNMTYGNDGNTNGYQHTKKAKQKISESKRGKPHPHLGHEMSEFTKSQLEKANKGRKFTEEHRAKLSASRIGEKHWNYGKHLSEETKAKISKALKS